MDFICQRKQNKKNHTLEAEDEDIYCDAQESVKIHSWLWTSFFEVQKQSEGAGSGLAKWFVQLSSSRIWHWGVTTVSVVSPAHPRRPVCRWAVLVITCPGCGCGQARSVLVEQCHKEEAWMLFPVIYCTYKVDQTGAEMSTSIFRHLVWMHWQEWQNLSTPFLSITSLLLDLHSWGKIKQKYCTNKVLITHPWTVTLDPRWCCVG